MKLSNKILFSYILLMVFAFTIGTGVTNSVVNRRLTDSAYEHLNVQADQLLDLVSSQGTDAESMRRSILFLRRSGYGQTMPATVLIFNAKNRLAFTSDDRITEKNAKELLDASGSDYLVVKRALNVNAEPEGLLVLVSDTSYIKTSLTIVRRSLFMGFLLAMTLAVVIALIMGRRIIRPIKSLKEDMEITVNDHSHVPKQVHTGDEIEALYKAYKSMNQAINDHLEERKRFFQNASHELKTPLMSIQGYAEAIRDGVVEGDEVKESLEIIIHKSQELKRTVEELTFLSKLANKDFKYTFEHSSLNATVDRVIGNTAFLAEDKGIRIIVHSTPEQIQITMDEGKMATALENIVSNALRYAKNEIHIELADHLSDTIITIWDDGRGFDQGEAEKVFERFYKGQQGNSGIGLSVVEEIIQNHKGTIVATNGPAGGALFEIKLHKGVL